MGSVDVRVQFKARKHELNLTTHCMIVLCLFESLQESDSLSFQVSSRACSQTVVTVLTIAHRK